MEAKAGLEIRASSIPMIYHRYIFQCFTREQQILWAESGRTVVGFESGLVESLEPSLRSIYVLQSGLDGELKMYDVFDSFCKLPTWDTSHALDEGRFKAALSEVVHLPDFSPEEMGRYIQLNHAEPIWPKTAVQLDTVIDRLVEYATAEQNRMRCRV